MLNKSLKGVVLHNRRDLDALNRTVAELKTEHAQILETIERFEALTAADRETFNHHVAELAGLLFRHFKREEEQFFPAMMRLTGTNRERNHSKREHDQEVAALLDAGKGEILSELARFMAASREVFMLLTEHVVHCDHYDFPSAHARITHIGRIVRERMHYEETLFFEPFFQT